jgi:hypothetical protein
LAALAASLGDEAGAQGRQIPVVVVPGLALDDLEPLAQRGAVGLLVPAAGPRASQRSAEAALVRGEVRNSLRGGLPDGPPLITLERRERAPLQGPAIVLSLPQGGDQPNDRRYPIAVLGTGFRGLLKSSETRIPGIVSIVDVAPTALRTEDALESTDAEDQVARLRELDGRIDENNSTRELGSLVVWALTCVLAALFPRAAVLAFPSALAANLFLGAAGISESFAVVSIFALSVACAAPLAGHALRSADAVGLACVATLGAYLVAFAIDERWVALSPLGPTQNARFYGLSNLLETFILVPAIVGAVLLGRRHWSLFAATAVLSFVVVAGTRFGADGGGAVVLAAGYAAFAVAVSAARRRMLLVWTALAVALAGVLFALDEVTGTSSHVTRTIRGGPDDVAAALRDRITLSWERTIDKGSTVLVVVVSIAAFALLVYRLWNLEPSARRLALPLSIAAAIAASLVVNDSPVDVLVTGLVAYLAVESYALPDLGAASTFGRRLRLV